ncbi:MAG TPA: ABC transporter permease [Candidatus Limnocylindrales bacterium]|nr:ABC transporter permease [Candidatus Limnocylindrales bacterium]
MTSRDDPAPPGSTVFVTGQGTMPVDIAAPADVAAADVEVALESLGQWQLAWRRFKRHRMALFGLAFLAFAVLVAIIGPIVWPYDPLIIPGVSGTNPGGDSPSLAHLMGTDNNGRDVLQMVVNGARISMTIGITSMLIAGFVGITVGTLAGYFGGWVDNVLMRVVDTFFAIPLLFVILVAAAFFGEGKVISLVLIFGLLSWPLIARLIRAQFLSLREVDFVEAARAVGVSDLRIAFRDILPNAIGPIIVAMTLIMANNIILEAFVSYLNFGISADQISWGNALAQSQNYLVFGNWWWAFFPGIAIALTVIAINFIGDGLRDALDPRTRL